MGMLGAGIGLGAAGGFLNAFGAGRAARKRKRAEEEAYRQYELQAQRAMYRLGGNVIGFGGMDDFQKAATPLTGNTTVDQGIMQARQRYEAANPSLTRVLTDAGDRQNATLEGIAGDQRANNRQLRMLTRQMEGAGSDLQARQAATIRRDSQRALASDTAGTRARMNLLGPSTLGEQQVRAVREGNSRAQTDALLANDQAALGRFLQTRQNRIGIEGGLNDAEYQTRAGLASQRYANALAPAQARANTFGAQTFNPYQGMNMMQFNSGVDERAARILAFGDYFTSVGGQMTGAGMMGGGGQQAPKAPAYTGTYDNMSRDRFMGHMKGY
jgi:hypothetical protein